MMPLWYTQVSLSLLNQPSSVRAINLYAFQAAIFHPLGSSISGKARVLAALRIFEEAQANNERTRTLHERLGVAGYIALDQFLRKVDNRRFRTIGKMSDFSDEVDRGLDHAEDVADLVHVSHRIANFGPHKLNQMGGTTMARRFLSETAHGPKTRTFGNRLAPFKDREVMLYLILHHFNHLRPAQLSSKNFVTRLLNQSRDTEGLSAFFAGYADLAKVLRNQYHFENMIRPDKAPPTSFALTDFSKEERHFLENYKSKPKNTKKKSI
jgi:hypothetical protein